jgi:uncharacterized SAM-binding protein YcdF (DUF218 family)
MKYSAIIVLGNLMDKLGMLNEESASRMDIAIKAFHEKLAPQIITCGWAYRNDSAITIADAMKQYAIDIGGVPFRSILTEKSSRDTVGDAIFTKKFFATKMEWKNVLVATSDYHVSRASEIFEYVYGKSYIIEVTGAVTNATQEQVKSEKESIKAFYETFEGIKAGEDSLIHKRLCESHPYYNGLIHPKAIVA